MKIRIYDTKEYNDELSEMYRNDPHITSERVEWWSVPHEISYFTGTAEELFEYAREINEDIIFHPKEYFAETKSEEESIEIYNGYRE